ncbi:hypothetical protein [Paraburkholderia kururiensis]|uniref:hypothetical protein n=1 Tax=Paraburkholderia kururiensis TaxID=984307 RepID=UPI000347D25B|nr:hypothetical protein [Paraburkholderia kururiensis]
MVSLLDQEIAHIQRVMRASLALDATRALLPPSYWRHRLQRLVAGKRITQQQFSAIDGLLVQLDAFDDTTPPAHEVHAKAS